MRVAYLITAYGQWEHLERLARALECPETGIFIHIDARSKVPRGLLERLSARGVVFAPRRPVWWGGWSHTAAILSLMKLASGNGSGNWDYYVILSGADYPIRSNAVIFETLASGGEFINAAPGFRPSKPESRIRFYWLDGFDRRRTGTGGRDRSLRTWLFRGAEMFLRLAGIRKRRYPFPQIFSGVVWGALSGGCVDYILEYLSSHPRYVSFFRTALVPEEMFFATIVGNSPFSGRIRGTLTFMDWDHTGASPPRITPAHLPRLAPGSCDRLFARKFDDLSGPLLDRIDNDWRQRPVRENSPATQ